MTTISASGFARRARRTAWRDFWSAAEVTVQVLTSDEVGRGAAVDERDAALAEEAGGRFHLGLVDLAAEVGDRGRPDGGHHSCGFVLIRNPIVPTSAGHRVADVALALRAGQPDPVVGGGPDPDSRRRFGRWTKNARARFAA